MVPGSVYKANHQPAISRVSTKRVTKIQMMKIFVLSLMVGVAMAHNWTRIYDGHDAKVGQAPYQVRLVISKSNGMVGSCGGAIIGKRYVLTAAHCVDGKDPNKVSIQYNSLSWYGDGYTVKAKKIWTHSKYDCCPADYDIALIKTEKMQLGLKNAEKIDLPEKDFELSTGDSVTISGWGIMGEDGEAPDTLQIVETKVVDWEKCNSVYVEGAVTHRQFCAGDGGKYGMGGKACPGDSGGPVVHNGKLAGIFSSGGNCGGDLPGINTRVSKFIDWIHNRW